MAAAAYPVGETAFGEGIWQLPGVDQILQVVADLFGRVLQDWKDKVLFIIILTCVGFAEGAGPLTRTPAVERSPLCTALFLLLHAEHQLFLHPAC